MLSRDIAFKLVTGIIFINPFIYPLSTTKSFFNFHGLNVKSVSLLSLVSSYLIQSSIYHLCHLFPLYLEED
jgi:hypothetical protein